MRTRTRATLWILSVFLLGTLFGATLSYVMMDARGHDATFRTEDREEAGKRNKRSRPAQLFARLSRELELTPEQRSVLRGMLEEQRESYRAILAEKEASTAQLRREARRRFREILTPEQLEKFNEFMKRHRRKNHSDDKRSPDSPNR